MFERCTCDETDTDLVELAHHRSGTAIHRIYTALHHRGQYPSAVSVLLAKQSIISANDRLTVAYRLPRLR